MADILKEEKAACTPSRSCASGEGPPEKALGPLGAALSMKLRMDCSSPTACHQVPMVQMSDSVVARSSRRQ